MRVDGRKADQLRPVHIVPNYSAFAEGSIFISIGETQVLCNMTVQEGVPRWMQTGAVSSGWITAEYAMLPRSTQERTPRETNGLSGRTQEIRRLIGRSLRASVDLEKLGPLTCILDCDVLQADGGTRTAAITGGYLALAFGLRKLIDAGRIPAASLRAPIAAISVGIVDGAPLLDLCYAEDRQAQVDANIVMDANGYFIEIQSSAERKTFSSQEFDRILELAYQGIGELLTIQKKILNEIEGSI